MAKTTSSPLQFIQEGLEAADWKKVAKGYQQLTGVKIEPPKAGKPVKLTTADIPDAIRALIVEEAMQSAREIAERIAGVVHGQVAGNLSSLTLELIGSLGAEPAPAPKPAKKAKAVVDSKDDDEAPAKDDERPKGREARTLPWDAGTFRNEFVDDGRLVKDRIGDSKKMSEKFEPSEKRPAVVERKIKVTCSECERDFKVDAADAPVRLGSSTDGEDAMSSYTCQRCLRGMRGK